MGPTNHLCRVHALYSSELRTQSMSPDPSLFAMPGSRLAMQTIVAPPADTGISMITARVSAGFRRRNGFPYRKVTNEGYGTGAPKKRRRGPGLDGGLGHVYLPSMGRTIVALGGQ